MFNWYAAYLIYSFWFNTEASLGHNKQLRWRFFVEIFSLTVVTKNFVLEATGVLDPCDRL